jgi:hypothetical protein
MYWLDAFPNTTDYCVINATATGLTMAMRQSQTLNATLVQCSLLPEPAIVFPDRARFLRAQCLAGGLQGLQGTISDLCYGEPQTDTYAETICCQSTLPDFPCCPLLPPNQCWVVQTPSLLVPSNPWLNVYVFALLNDAIVKCAATQRVILIVGSGDPFGTGDTTPKVYTEVISATVPLVAINGTTGPMLIQAGTGVTWRSANNRLNTQCVPTTLMGFDFEHDGTVGKAIWQQTAGTGTDACNLRFKGDAWNVTVDELAIRAVVGDNFTIDTNVFTGSLLAATRFGVSLVGNGSCSENPVVVYNSDFNDFAGYGLYIDNVALYNVRYNTFDNVGGQDFITLTPYSVYVSVCSLPTLPKSMPVRFENNRVRTTQTAFAAVGEMATCWLGNVPLNDKIFSILSNNCRGLAFGMRFENMPDTSPSSDPKAQLRTYALSDNNINTRGFSVPPLNKRFDLVRGPPADDASLVSDPNSSANVGRWCTDGCPIDRLAVIWAIVAILAVCLVLLLCLCILTGWCTPYRYRDPLLTFHQVQVTRPNAAQYGNGVLSPLLPPPAAAPVGAEMRRRTFFT